MTTMLRLWTTVVTATLPDVTKQQYIDGTTEPQRTGLETTGLFQ